MNFPLKVVNYVIVTISSYEQNMIEFEKENGKTPKRDKQEYCDVIQLLPLLGVNHCLTLLHISPKNVYINTSEKLINPFAIVYTINPHYMLARFSEIKFKNDYNKYFIKVP